MNALIKENLKYPAEALKNKIEGKVQLRYEIDYKGNVVKAKVISSLGYGCDEEAQRLVKLLKFHMPKIPRKVRLKFNKTIRINFKLPKKKPKKVTVPMTKAKVVSGSKVKRGTKVTYQVIPKKKAPSTGETPTTGYTYTIRY